MPDLVLHVSFNSIKRFFVVGVCICCLTATLFFAFIDNNKATSGRQLETSLPWEKTKYISNPFFLYGTHQVTYQTGLGAAEKAFAEGNPEEVETAAIHNEGNPKETDRTTLVALKPEDEKSTEDRDKEVTQDDGDDSADTEEASTPKHTYVWDAIITYVNGSDPAFIANMNRYVQESGALAATNPARFQDRDDLRMLFRSIEAHATFFRQIFLVVAYESQVPTWLNISHPLIQIIYHRDIFPNQSDLPTLSTTSVEAVLHFIPNLSPYALYFNYNYMLVNDVTPDAFHDTLSDGELVFYVRPEAPHHFSLKQMSKDDPKAHWLAPAVNAARLIRKVCKKSSVNEIVGYRSWQASTPTIFLKEVFEAAENVPVIKRSLDYTRGHRFPCRDCIHAFLFHHWYAQCARNMEARAVNKGDGRVEIYSDAGDQNFIRGTLKTIRKLKVSVKRKNVKFLVVSDESKSSQVTKIGSRVERIILQWRLSLQPNKSSFEL